MNAGGDKAPCSFGAECPEQRFSACSWCGGCWLCCECDDFDRIDETAGTNGKRKAR